MKYFFITIAILGGLLYGSMLRNKTNTLRSFNTTAYAHDVVGSKAQEKKPSVEEVISEILEVFKKEPLKVRMQALNCFYGESKFKWDAHNFNKNKTWDLGICQINDIHGLSIEERLDYKKNIQFAYKLFKKRGFTAWYAKACN